MCFYANPLLGHPISGCQHREEEFKNMSALMSTLRAHVLLSLVITHWTILNKQCYVCTIHGYVSDMIIDINNFKL